VPPASSGLSETTGFDPYKEIHQTRRKNYPHWLQEGGTYFVTFRLADSIPQSRIKEYEELRRKWQEHHHPPYTQQERDRFNELFCERVDKWLDEGAGACCLRDSAFSEIVANVLQHFDGMRYKLDEWVVMPNHVHLIVQPLGDHQLPDILHSWKSFSSNQINRALKRSGRLWQKEYYDHLIRNTEELYRIRSYIRNNPQKAGIHVPHSSGPQDVGDTVPPASSGLQGRQDVGDTVPPASSGQQGRQDVGDTVPPASCGQHSRQDVGETVPPASCGPISAFRAFMRWSDWLYAQTRTTGNLHMVRLAKLLMTYLTKERGLSERAVAEALWSDYSRGNRPDVPGFLKKFGFEQGQPSKEEAPPSGPPRQSRHRK
jgi:REP element-mobilizing transposase RayT